MMGYNVSLLARRAEQMPEEAVREGMGADNRLHIWDIAYSTLREVDGAFHHISGRGVDMRTVEALNGGRIQTGDICMRAAKRDGVNYTEYLGVFANGTFIISMMM
jgi:hypothetical protein